MKFNKVVNTAKQVKVFRDIELMSDRVDKIVDRLPKGSLSAQAHGRAVCEACDKAKLLVRLALVEDALSPKVEILKALDAELSEIESIMDSFGRRSSNSNVRVMSVKQKTSFTECMFVIRTQVSAWLAKYRALEKQQMLENITNGTTSAD